MENSLQQEINLLHSQICHALADPKRISLLYAMDKGPQRVTGLAETLDVPQPTVSYHLKILREQGLVITEPEGTAIYYSLADHRIIKALDMLRAMLADILAQQAELLKSV